LATHGSLGGLHSKIIDITDIVKAAAFDYIIIATVGVGQSEVEIAGLADTTVVVLVAEAGDEIQTMKVGLMEIADIFVVNKADRRGAELFIKNLRTMLSPDFNRKSVPIVKTIASAGAGINELVEKIEQNVSAALIENKLQFLTEKSYQLIQKNRMEDIDKMQLQEKLESAIKEKGFNLYAFVNANF
jgi:LAO/AO transport system kinase